MNPSTHMTTGTDRREARSLSGEGIVFRLSNEIQELRQDLARSSGQRSAKTLAKSGGLRVTLVELEANATIQPEATNGASTVHVIDGRLRLQTSGSIHEIGPGEMVVLEQNLREPIQAAERSSFLVTVAWPQGAGAWDQEQASGRH
jgi:quercetin dioxygenase-like cupin family protein